MRQKRGSPVSDGVADALEREGFTVPDAERIRRETKYANSLATQIQDGKDIATCIEAWAQDLAGAKSYCGSGFIIECRMAKNAKIPPTTGGKNQNQQKCSLCRKQGHVRKNCPWGNGRPIPENMICSGFNNGTCYQGRNCSLMHICSKCRRGSEWHRKTECRAATA